MEKSILSGRTSSSLLNKVLFFLLSSLLINQVQANLFSETGAICNEWKKNDFNILNPWPKNCKIYSTTNACN